jgi:hypothetical protein
VKQVAIPSTLLVVFLLLGLPGAAPPAPVSSALSTATRSSCDELAFALSAELYSPETMRVLIATVPDPDASGLTYAFDLAVDAIQRALGQAGYTLVRFKLPWQTNPDAGTACPDLPGFLVATKSPGDGYDEGRRIVVLLVGETPTAGVSSSQLTNARQFAEEANTRFRLAKTTSVAGSAERPILVLGPTFSGTAPSLRQNLGSARTSIVSGSATAKDLELDGEFRRTVVPDDLVLRTMLGFLRSHGARNNEIALLIESNTAYGSGLKSAVRETDGGVPTDDGVHLLVPFPLGVHRLREDEPQAAAASAPFGTIGLPLLQDRVIGTSVIPQFSRTSESFDERRLEDTLESLARSKIRFIGILATNDLDKLFLATRVRAFCPNATIFTLESSLLFTHPDEARVTAGMLVGSTYPLIPLNQEWTPWSRGGQEVLQTFGSGAGEGIFNAVLALLHEAGDYEGALADYTMPFLRGAGRPAVWLTVVGNGSMWPVSVTRIDKEAGALGHVYVDTRARTEGEGSSRPDHSSAPWGAIGAFVFASLWVLVRTVSFWWAAKLVDRPLVVDSQSVVETQPVVDGQKHRLPRVLLPFGDLPTVSTLRGEPPKLALIDPKAKAEVLKAANRTYSAAFRVRRDAVQLSLFWLFVTILVGYVLVSLLALVPAWTYGTLESWQAWRRAVIAAMAGFALGAASFTTIAAPSLVEYESLRTRGIWYWLFAGLAGAVACVLVLGPFVASRVAANDLLWYERSIAFTSGVTIVIPLAALWLGIYLFARGHLQSLVGAPVALHQSPRKVNPLVEVITGELPSPPTRDDERQVLARDLHPVSWPHWRATDALVALGLSALPLSALFILHRRSLDSRAEHIVLLGAIAVVVIALAWCLRRVLSGTDALLRFLRFLELEPGFDRLTVFFRTLPHKEFGRFQVLHSDIRLLAEFGRRIRSGATGGTAGSDPWSNQLAGELKIYDRSPAWSSRTFESMRIAASKATEQYAWSRPRMIRFEGSDPDLTTVGSYLVLVVSWALTTIRNFLVIAAILSACLWIAFVSYPQSPHHLLLVVSWLAMALCLVVGVITFVRFDRNEVLSRMSGTKEGKVTFDFDFFKANLPLVLAPALAIVVLEFPQFGRWLTEWAQPLLRNLK